MSEPATELPVTEASEHLAEVAEAAHEGKVIYLTTAGQRIAAVVPLELIELVEDWEDVAAAEAALAEGGEPIPLEEIKAEFGR
ncbi:MAG: type II toxin-antitoxin system prevent-host-death family antitoxin [Mycobacteriales bacterium]